MPWSQATDNCTTSKVLSFDTIVCITRQQTHKENNELKKKTSRRARGVCSLLWHLLERCALAGGSYEIAVVVTVAMVVPWRRGRPSPNLIGSTQLADEQLPCTRPSAVVLFVRRRPAKLG